VNIECNISNVSYDITLGGHTIVIGVEKVIDGGYTFTLGNFTISNGDHKVRFGNKNILILNLDSKLH